MSVISKLIGLIQNMLQNSWIIFYVTFNYDNIYLYIFNLLFISKKYRLLNIIEEAQYKVGTYS